MKNEVFKLGLLYLFIGLIISSCSISNGITSCPNFKSKKQKGVFAIANNAKKKHKKSSQKKRVYSSEINSTTKQVAINQQEAVNPLNSIDNFISKPVVQEEVSTFLPKVYSPSAIATQNKANENSLNKAIASTQNLMEITPFAKLKSLGISHIQYDEGLSTLSKKEIKAIKKQAKKELKKKLHEERDSNSKLAAVIGYLGLIGFLVSYLALHKKGDEFSAFHLRQSLGINLLYLLPLIGLFSFVGSSLTIAGIGLGIAALINIAIFVMWLLGIIGAAQGDKKPVFLLGEFFQKLFKGIN